ncbi:hypothetical protein N7486_000627 [Penicillium sp. IBT 16267x]|nr:hypothetical protein N7486_000627 [Penicillium sp. IBT 16267x]
MPFLPFNEILSLRKELEGSGAEISTWGCHGYDDRIKQWSASCDTEVGALIRVTSADEAAKVVCFATNHSIPLVVKSGGCSTSGASTIHGGIVLDLFNLRKVQVDAGSRVVIAEGGALWEDIDVAAAQHGLAVVGSTLNQIGAAGATLGGGYGWLTGQYGLAIDNLLWARIILADVLFYNGTQAAAERFFSPLISLQPTVNSTQMLPYDGVNGMLSGIFKVFRRENLGNFDIPSPNNTSVEPRKSLDGSNFTLPSDITFAESIYDEFNRALQQWPQAGESKIFFEILPNKQVNKIANHNTAFASRGPYYNVSSLFKWYEASSENMIRKFQRYLMEKIGNQAGISQRHDYCKAEHGTGLYANYAGRDLPVEAIFGNNLARLRKLKNTYDPQNMFRHWHNIQEPLKH